MKQCKSQPIQSQQEPKHEHSEKYTLILKVLISYLYFIQGIFMSLPLSFILTFSKIPQYNILSLFTASALPYSLKFISAPIIQKYTSYVYGRRKTWIIVSQSMMGVFVHILTYFSEEEDQIYAGIIFIIIVFFTSLQDVSVDAFAIKQLKCPETVSFLQSINLNLGLFTGGMVFIQLVSPYSFLARLFGCQLALIGVDWFLHKLTVLILLPTIIIHLYYKQLITKEQQLTMLESKKSSLWSLMMRYKQFMNPKYRACRQIIVLMLSSHGINYFASSFPIQMMKRYGLSKELQTTLKDVSIIPFMVAVYIISQTIKQKKGQRQHFLARLHKIHRYQFRIIAMRSVLVLSMFLLMPYIATSITISSICILILSCLFSVQHFMDTSLVNTHAYHSKYSGMYGTMMASFGNLGRNTSINLQIISYTGFHWGCILGSVVTIFWVMIYMRVCKWVRQGKSEMEYLHNIKIDREEGKYILIQEQKQNN